MVRKFRQLAFDPQQGTLYAVAEDGTAWWHTGIEWKAVCPLPEDDDDAPDSSQVEPPANSIPF